MENNRILKYAIVDVDEKYVFVQITEQSHIGDDFTKDGFTFEHNGFKLKSDAYPAYLSVYKEEFVYVRGDNYLADNDTIMLPHNVFFKFKHTVKAYNKGD